jgi:thioredoxin 1
MVGIKTKEELKNLCSESGDKLVILKFSALWCQPCRMLGNVIRELEGTMDNVVFAECNVDESDELVTEYRIQNIPQMFFFKNGYQIDKIIGSKSRSELIKAIKENLKK